eukprot:CAMPEP_0116013476 /NCGR_PEP_ID=MMETSP0321-20121206/5748_1 /TAXON_ID=163516 /ORGANISM="Leptocylindrus danicus var. danicus, Strain B650" /LENGTH=299 /DNA_ID=CAMNT_0003483031 /DNA_START=111 /DNA_END=1007 /DNA_ORIENTATION=+
MRTISTAFCLIFEHSTTSTISILDIALKLSQTSQRNTLINIEMKAEECKYRHRNDMNVPRKLQHGISGLLFLFLHHLYPSQSKIFFLALTISTLFVELLRRIERFYWANDVIFFFCGDTLRKHEMDLSRDGGRFTGSFYFFIGTTLTVYSFQHIEASFGLLHLALADPAASFFGRLTANVGWSRISDHDFPFGIGNGKGLLGLLGGSLFCAPFNYLILTSAHWDMIMRPKADVILLMSFVLGVAGSFADFIVPSPTLQLTRPSRALGLVDIPAVTIDDNVVIPIFTATICKCFFTASGW